MTARKLDTEKGSLLSSPDEDPNKPSNRSLALSLKPSPTASAKTPQGAPLDPQPSAAARLSKKDDELDTPKSAAPKAAATNSPVKPAKARTIKTAIAPAKAEPVETDANLTPSAPASRSSVESVSVAEAPAPAPPTVVGAAPAQSPTPDAPPVSSAARKAVKPAATGTIERPVEMSEQKTMKNNTNRLGFKLNEYVVYPAHGVGQIVSVEEQEVAGFKLELFVISFVKDKMTLRVPTSKVAGVGMRKLSDPDAAKRSLEILSGRARIKRTMWSRRAQEYEAKINSGDINAIAEVVRDLYRSDAQPEQSYSERQLYEAALDRMMREIAVVHKVSETEAHKLIESHLKKNVKRAGKTDALDGDAETEAETEAETDDIEEAA